MRDSWEIRFEWIQTILQWVSLVAGVGISFVQIGFEPATVASSIAVTAYTIAMQTIPYRHKRTPLVAGLLSLLGVLTALFAIGLTGGLESAFLLYLAVPVFFASAFRGMVLGGFTTLAAIAGLIAIVTTTTENPLSPMLHLMIVFYALIGITFAQAHRILIEEPRSNPEALQLERLEAAHQLLADLVDLAGSAELNPITIGRAALRDLGAAVPFAAGTIAIIDHDEEIIAATRGQPGPDDECSVYDIRLLGSQVGILRLWPMKQGQLDAHEPQIRQSMDSVSLAFDNVLLLQSIAHRAVREERVRLARELHDDIGPSLVSVGLGLDLLIHSPDADPDTAHQLRAMRETIGDLVDEVRTTVTHLRSTESGSLADHAHLLAEQVPANGPAITISIDEDPPPEGHIASQISAIITEAVRNAVEHAEASVITIEGQARGNRGHLKVTDNGHGMSRKAPVGDHYGIIGMQERADDIGAKLSIDSARGVGTTIEIVWGTP